MERVIDAFHFIEYKVIKVISDFIYAYKIRCKMKKLTSILLTLFFVFSFANAADAS